MGVQSPKVGKGSTMVKFNLQGCNLLANAPEKLLETVRSIISARLLVPREINLLDSWGTAAQGACTVFVPLEESHVRVSVRSPEQFVRCETWPDRNNYIDGEIQLCNYTRDNRILTRELFKDLRAALDPQHGSYIVIECGPDSPLKVVEGPRLFGTLDESPARRHSLSLIS